MEPKRSRKPSTRWCTHRDRVRCRASAAAFWLSYCCGCMMLSDVEAVNREGGSREMFRGREQKLKSKKQRTSLRLDRSSRIPLSRLRRTAQNPWRCRSREWSGEWHCDEVARQPEVPAEVACVSGVEPFGVLRGGSVLRTGRWPAKSSSCAGGDGKLVSIGACLSAGSDQAVVRPAPEPALGAGTTARWVWLRDGRRGSPAGPSGALPHSGE